MKPIPFTRPHLALFFPLLFLYSSVFTQINQAEAKPEDMMATAFNLTLQHATLVVSDFGKSREFYVETLGLKDLNIDWLPENQMFLSLGENLELHVGEVEGVEINPSSFNHLAISTNDLDGYLEHLRSKGVKYSSLGGAKEYYIQKRPDGVSQTFLQDPDGYWIEINDAN